MALTPRADVAAGGPAAAGRLPSCGRLGEPGDGEHRFAKPLADEITLLTGIGVQDDAHAGVSVQHRSRVAVDPSQPNLRQVHLIHAELHDKLRDQGFDVRPGQLGENITTRGLDLLALPRGSGLRLGSETVVEVTGLRNPCTPINAFRPGLLKSVLDHDEQGRLMRKAGIMAIVLHGGPFGRATPLSSTSPPSHTILSSAYRRRLHVGRRGSQSSAQHPTRAVHVIRGARAARITGPPGPPGSSASTG